ncbi:MAG: T9SS type A sorting domain-containing protein, partial [Candidatus Kapaibacterium sp.]
SDEEVVDEGFAMDNFLISESGAPPSDISISNSSIMENEDIGTSIGILSTTDPDDTEHEYSFDESVVSDNTSFSLVDDEVFSAEVFDFETKTSYTINIQTEDSKGNTLSKILSISITNDAGDDPLVANDMESYGVKVHPNPVKGRLNMNMLNDYFGEVRVRVYSIDGKSTVIENTVRKDGYSVNGLIDLNILPRGLYIVEFTMGDKILTGKVIKE